MVQTILESVERTEAFWQRGIAQYNKMIERLNSMMTDLYSGVFGQGFMDNMATVQQQFKPLVIDDDKVYIDVCVEGGGNIPMHLDGVWRELDCTTGDGEDGSARVEIMQGTESDVRRSFVYAVWSEDEEKVVLSSSIFNPSGAFYPICYIGIQSHTEVASHGAIMWRRTTDVITHGEQGSISRGREFMRLASDGRYSNGVDPTLEITTNAGSLDNVNLKVTDGNSYQLNLQYDHAIDISSDGIYLVGMQEGASGSLENFDRFTNIGEVNELADGTALIDNDRVIFDIFYSINYTPNGEDTTSKLFIVAPIKKFTTDATAEDYANNGHSIRIPQHLAGVSFGVCSLVLKYNTADSGTWTNVLTDTVSGWEPLTGFTTWQSTNYPNNYPNNMNISKTYVGQVGTISMRIGIDGFNMEANYDYLYVRDDSNTLRNTLNGNLGSNPMQLTVSGTDELRLNSTTDGSVTRKGFRVTSVDIYRQQSGAGGEFIDRRLF